MTDASNTPRRWFITGANSGFGLALAHAALAVGDEVVAAVRRPETMAALAAESGGRLSVIELDVSKREQLPTAVEAAGRIDVLVNNAGFGIVGAIEETSEAELRTTMEVMFFGPLAHLTHLAGGLTRRATVTRRPALFLRPLASKGADTTPAQS